MRSTVAIAALFVGLVACGAPAPPAAAPSPAASGMQRCSDPPAAPPPAPPPATASATATPAPLPAATDEAHRAHVAARAEATRFVLAGDFEHAATALASVIPMLAKHPELDDEFWAHNTMMMIRTAQGDPAGALAENDQATLSAARGTWDPEHREKLALQKDRWHRAYLTRMLAESRTGSAKQSLVDYAKAALEEYRPVGFPDSIAILDAYFAALDGRPKDALAAAKKVDATKNDDLEDLYLVVVGLEAGGDHAAAENVRKVMRRAAGPHIAHAIMMRWVDLDTKPAKTRGFTPWNASAAR